MFSGDRVDLSRFREGWLLIGWGKAHYFTRTKGGFKADCGYRPEGGLLRDGAGFVAFEPGSFQRCKRCESA